MTRIKGIPVSPYDNLVSCEEEAIRVAPRRGAQARDANSANSGDDVSMIPPSPKACSILHSRYPVPHSRHLSTSLSSILMDALLRILGMQICRNLQVANYGYGNEYPYDVADFMDRSDVPRTKWRNH